MLKRTYLNSSFRKANGYSLDDDKFIPKGIQSLDSLKRALTRFNYIIGQKPIPRELIPYDFGAGNKIHISDGSKNLQEADEETFNILSPVSFEKRIASLSETADIQVEEIRTEHFGKSYEATSTTFFSRDNGQPIGKMVLYHPTWKQKITGNFFHPDFTFELIGYDREFRQRVSVGVTSYKNRKTSLFVYSAFDDLGGARIEIGFPGWLPQFTKRLTKVFKLGQ